MWTVLCTCFVYLFFLHPNRPFRDFLQSVHLPSSVGPSQVLINKMYSLLIQPRTGELTIISTIIIIKSLSHLSKPQGLTICVCVRACLSYFLVGDDPKGSTWQIVEGASYTCRQAEWNGSKTPGSHPVGYCYSTLQVVHYTPSGLLLQTGCRRPGYEDLAPMYAEQFGWADQI